ncbi:Zn(II)2Cys6 transcription factor [Penicillium odoratum]|uniref:Zn(II)2Cys6 transcription factor n=1 Tax=Penicillium odoratum TaxID=1167516 RepID=UPI002547A267|nr:Zn(II)2Cys6 transcription factor [Penicillium odoratum]KAJ5768811.1 Zn(II)2Cys6 transcription factor [Penicillium odoratum]
MTAIVTVPAMSSHDSGAEAGTEHSPSRFTAVNGKDSSVSKVNSFPKDRDTSPDFKAMPESESPEQEHSPEDHGSQRSSLEASVHTHKRKRSNSSSREHESRHPSELHGTVRGSKGNPTELSAPPNSNGAGSGSVSDLEPAPHGPSRSDPHESSRISSNGPWPEYDTQLASQAQRVQQIDASDAQLADALQREAHSLDPNHRNMNASRSTPAPTVQSSSSPPYSSERPTTAQMAPKRKRVFSNRTKTGCMTCRRRKKKCDEQHPACNNCLRGGFLCEGYTSRNMWQKPSNSKPPIPLQSKEECPESSDQNIPENQDRHLSEQMERKTRPIVEDERSAPQYNTSATDPVSKNHMLWPKRLWSNPGHSGPAYPPGHVAKGDYREVSSIHELPRDVPSKPDFPGVPLIREISHGPSPKTNGPLLFQGAVAPSTPATSLDTNSPQVQARMALSIENQLSSRMASIEDTEMDKMIKGDLYRPFDVYLVEERDRCRRALARFNNACNPLSGLSSKEQNRLLKEILAAQPPCTLKPPGSPGMSSPTMRRPTPSLGPGAIVESPFTCHYGYLSIGEDVMISHDCVFVDDCFIFVGAHTWVGSNVTILTTMAHSSMQERKGTQSRYQGRRVRIMEDCYIGAGCTIYPGVTLGRGAYIAPGEVVRSDVVPYGFQGFKPNYM